MIRRTLALLAAPALALGLWAGTAEASSPCGAAETCTETDSTHSTIAQFDALVRWCFIRMQDTSVNQDVRNVEVQNFSDDGQQHVYNLQIRREFPSNELIAETTVSIAFFDTYTWWPAISSRDEENQLYLYVKVGTGQIQRISPFHVEGDYPTWTVADRSVGSPGAFSC